MKAAEVQKELVERLVTALEAGDVGKWRKPWVEGFAAGWPTNTLTRKGYQGGNILALLVTQADKGYTSPHWATYKQWQQLLAGREDVPTSTKNGETVVAPVIKGQKATHLVRWVDRPPCKTHPADMHCDKCFGKPRMIPVGFAVFNAAQVVDGEAVAAERFPQPKTPTEWERDASIDAFVTGTGADVRHASEGAWYSPQLDWVNVPKPETFYTVEGYYGTLLHELTHWTGHKSRLDRDQTGRFGSESYAFEELVAELGAVFLTSGRFGFELPERDDHAAYLAHWAKALRAKPSILWTAAGAASKAVEHLEGLQPAVEVPELLEVAA